MRYRDSQTRDWWRKRTTPHSVAVKERASDMVETMRANQKAHSSRLQMCAQAAALYGHAAGFGAALRTGAKPLRENVLAQYMDTWMSYIGRSCPRPMFVPIDGDSEAIDRAARLGAYIDALFQRTEHKRLRFEAIRDSGLFGLRCIQPYRPRDGAPIQLRRISPIHIAMDDVFGNELPYELGIQHITSRSWLRAMFPHLSKEIDHAPPAERTAWIARRSGVDAVEVWEAWHIEPWADEEEAGEEGHGIHIVGFHGCELYSEPWPLARFPLALGRAIPPVAGWWGNTYYDRLASIQEELNRQTRMEQEIMHTFALPRWWLPNGSSVAETKVLNDGIGLMIRLSGAPPVNSSPTVPADIWSRSDRRRAQMSEGLGISQLAASQLKPAGIESAPAFQAYADFQDMRHSFTFEEDAASTVALARACLDLERMEFVRNPSHKVPAASGRNGLSTYAWPLLDYDEANVALSVMPAGILPTSPAGRRDAIAFLRKQGLIDDQMVQRLLDAPDIDAARGWATAPERVIVDSLDAICRGEDPTDHQPDAFMDMGLARRLWAQRMAMARTEQRPAKVLQRMRDWRKALQNLRDNMNGLKPNEAEALGWDTEAAAAEAAMLAPPQVTPGTGPVPGMAPINPSTTAEVSRVLTGQTPTGQAPTVQAGA